MPFVETVLCRILTELKLLDTTVGIVVLAAGVGNDVVGWVLLALTVTLVNATSGLDALYVFLTGVGWTLFMLFPIRIGFRYIARRTGSLESGEPSPSMMLLTFLVVFISAFFTDVIGEYWGLFIGRGLLEIVVEFKTHRYPCYLWRVLGWTRHAARWRLCDCCYRKDRRSCHNPSLAYRACLKNIQTLSAIPS